MVNGRTELLDESLVYERARAGASMPADQMTE